MNLTATASRKIAVPPTDEQRAVVDMLDRGGERHLGLIARVHEAIERLRELRSALISAAVTGKMDVRGEAPELPEDQ
jgi:type I restriction enzyme S subunit